MGVERLQIDYQSNDGRVFFTDLSEINRDSAGPTVLAAIDGIEANYGISMVGYPGESGGATFIISPQKKRKMLGRIQFDQILEGFRVETDGVGLYIAVRSGLNQEIDFARVIHYNDKPGLTVNTLIFPTPGLATPDNIQDLTHAAQLRRENPEFFRAFHEVDHVNPDNIPEILFPPVPIP